MRTILITGTRKGIGRYLAEAFLNRGYIVYGCSRGLIDLNHINYCHFTLDVSDEKIVKEMFFNIGRIDVLINNAGVASMNSCLLITSEKVKEIMNTNFLGTFLCSREAVKIMIKQKSGSIINFSSIAVPLRLEGEAVYAASKAAVESLTWIMAKELKNYNISINAIRPAMVKTDLTKSLPENNLPVTTFENILKVIDELINSNETGIIRSA